MCENAIKQLKQGKLLFKIFCASWAHMQSSSDLLTKIINKLLKKNSDFKSNFLVLKIGGIILIFFSKSIRLNKRQTYSKCLKTLIFQIPYFHKNMPKLYQLCS